MPRKPMTVTWDTDHGTKSNLRHIKELAAVIIEDIEQIERDGDNAVLGHVRICAQLINTTAGNELRRSKR